MKQAKGFMILLAVTSLSGTGAFAQKDVSSEIQKENDQISAAIISGSFDEISDRYTDDAVIIPPNAEPMVGREAVSLMWQSIQNMGVTMKFETGSAELYGNVAVEQGKYELFAGKDLLIDYGNYIVIWEKTDGKWKIKKDIWNTGMPPAPKAQVNDTVMFFSFRFRESDTKKLDTFNDTYFIPAMKEFYPDMFQRITLAEDIKSGDGYITRHYFVFPYHSSDNHSVRSVVMKKFNEPGIEEKISEIYSLYEVTDQRFAVVKSR